MQIVCAHRKREIASGCAERWRFVSLLVLLLAFGAARATAEEPPAGPYRVHWVGDVLVTGAASATWITLEQVQSGLVRKSCPCSTSALNFLDRGTAGVDRHAPAVASDVGLLIATGAGAVLDAVDVATHDASARSWLEDALVMAQAITLNGALVSAWKPAVSRPRPLLYGKPAGDPALDDPANYVSFYSGHTSGAFAATLSYAQTFALRHPGSPYRPWVYAGAIVLASGVGALRVLSGQHFTTDVLAGAVAGSAIGLLVPWLHARDDTHVVGQSTSLRIALVPLRSAVLLTVSGSAF